MMRRFNPAAALRGRATARAFSSGSEMHSTTIVCVRKGDEVVMCGDGQVSAGSQIVKPNAQKVRRISDSIIAGFAGSTADAFTLIERLESKLEQYPGQLTRASVELAKAWRTDKYLRRLEASLIVADGKNTYELTGNGDVLEPMDGVVAIGSGAPFATAAARALSRNTDLAAEDIARQAMEIAGDMCVYTNHNVVVEKLAAAAETE